MDDPFVKRMMERSKARQKILGRVFGDKENVSGNICSTLGPKGNKEDAASCAPVIPTSQSINLSPVKDANFIPVEVTENTILKPKFHEQNLDPSTNKSSITCQPSMASSGKRFNKLALVSKRMQDWEDDYSYHSEAQGFTPSESKSKLSFDFGQKKPPQDALPKGSDSPLPPKIISYYSKSPRGSPQSKNPNVTTLKNANQSPSKVTNLRHKWEEHIKVASPERTEANLSPSQKLQSPASKAQIRSPNITVSSGNFHRVSPSPTKSYCTLPKQKKSDVAIGFKHNAAFRSSLQSLSPNRHSPANLQKQKPTVTSPGPQVIVKGESVLSGISPLIENPSRLSVKEKAAAFASVLEPSLRVPEKDPAELSIKDRKNIFEKKVGEPALIPKAPFAQPVPAKVLQLSVEVNRERSPDGSVQQLNKTSILHKKSEICKPFDLQKKFFEIKDQEDWKKSDVSAKTSIERKEDMDVLLNRFKKPRHKRAAPAIPCQPESESESDDSSAEPQPRLSIRLSKTLEMEMASPTKSQKPPQFKSRIHSPSKRLNSTELGENSPTKKEYVPRIKPGCLFPSLSDIESHSEAAESQDEEDVKGSSFTASVDSLREESKSITKRTTLPAEGVCKRKEISMCSDSVMDAIGEIDNALDEAFNDSTPPKKSRGKKHSTSDSYRNPRVSESISDPTSTDSSGSSEESLAHSISMYRKQKPSEINYTPVRKIIRTAEVELPVSPVTPSLNIGERIRALQEEEELQLTVISQASNAINVAQRPEQNGTTQHLEAEKLLLVATQKRQCALGEIQCLKADGALGRKRCWPYDEDCCWGSISISDIALPLKQSFIHSDANESFAHYFLVLVKHRDQVITSELQKAPKSLDVGAVTFSNLMSLHKLMADFNIALEVYCFKIQSNKGLSAKKDFRKDPSRLILTPLKRLQKESRMSSPVVPSPGGPYAVRSSAFLLVGFANLNINSLTRSAWTLEKVPFNSPLDGHLIMKVKVSMEGGVREKSFLTMFEDVGGFGAWNRRWCVLDRHLISYWTYPDDETKKECLGQLDLRMCTTRKVELVSRDVCARQFTLDLTLVRPARPGDQTDLVSQVKNNTVISRILLSADSKEERIRWCNKLNKALANIRAWNPDALRPEDYHV